MRLVSVIAATFVVAACQPAVTETAAPEADTTEATGSADAAATDAAMPDASSDPEAFVRNIYSAMAGGELAPLGEEGEVLWTTAAWNDLEAARAIGVEVGDDPFCRCQDPTGLTVQSVDVTETGPGRADAAVEIMQGGDQTSLTLNLVNENGGWRIDEISQEGEVPFRQSMGMATHIPN